MTECEPSTSTAYSRLILAFSSKLKYDARSFDLVATLLRMSTKYQVSHLRKDLLRGLSASWPTRLLQWDTRESLATDSDGVYEPGIYPHPM